ncbi:hypothetical protein DRJ25_02515 [Candidatus Woesearchaeota archaeon]|nr:MAG: hypothetical protein DRJ25_02515 [Candidatus Woesearchaeota archaeon]
MPSFLEKSKKYLTSKMRFLLFLWTKREKKFSIREILEKYNGNIYDSSIINFIKNELIPRGIIIKKIEKSKYLSKFFVYYEVDEEKLRRFIVANILDNILWDMITEYSLEKGKVIGKFTFPEPPEPI